MKTQFYRLLLMATAAFTAVSLQAATTYTVTTTDNANSDPGKLSFKQALAAANEQSDVTINFNIPGDGPHYIATPPGGYAFIFGNNVTINGYSQPTSSPNTNPILAANNAKIKIVLDSRNGNYTSMQYNPNGENPGYGTGEVTILGVVDGVNFDISGISFLGIPEVAGPASLYFIAFAIGPLGATGPANHHVHGCWMGVDPNGTTVAGAANALTAFGADLINGITIGVKAGSANAPAEFNVIVGCPQIPIILEGEGTRISGNFIGVLPDGNHDYNTTMDPVYGSMFEGNIEIGDGVNVTIGTDGDGVNDANERNIIGGMLPVYDHNIEFYGGSRTNCVLAGNYVGLGVDGITRFTNGAPAFNASGGSAQWRFGSNGDGVSDDVEGNVVANYWPPTQFPPATIAQRSPNDLNVFSELDANAQLIGRGNTWINDLAAPISPTKNSGATLTNYMAKALADTTKGLAPVVSADSSTSFLLGTAPLAKTATYPTVILDLYNPDPESIATGKATGLPAFTDGFVLSKKWLAQFVVDGVGDQDPTAGAFKFDISSLGLKGGDPVTVTVTYQKPGASALNPIGLTGPFSAVVALKGPAERPVMLPPSLSGNTLTLNWSGGKPPFQVLSRPNVTGGAWGPVGAATSERTANVTVSGNAFYIISGQP